MCAKPLGNAVESPKFFKPYRDHMIINALHMHQFKRCCLIVPVLCFVL